MVETTESSSTGLPVSGPGSGPSDCQSPLPDQVLEFVLDDVLHFLTSRRDRSAASLVSWSWCKAEARTRSELLIGNCYAVSPRRATQRFPRVRSVTIKGKPLVPELDLDEKSRNWQGQFRPWAAAMAKAYPRLEKVHLKRMSVANGDLVLLANSFAGFKDLVLVECHGFGNTGLAAVASKCRLLSVFNIVESTLDDEDVEDEDVEKKNWISCFPEGLTHLESLVFECFGFSGQVNFEALEKLVARSPLLRKLSFNSGVSNSQLCRLMHRAPHLTHLGTVSIYEPDLVDEQPDYASSFAACESLVCLSGLETWKDNLAAIYLVCANLLSLNLSCLHIDVDKLKQLISHCHKLRTLLVRDSICDEGLHVVAATCKDLHKLQVFPTEEKDLVSEIGFQAIAQGCRKLQYICIWCQRMTNAAMITVSKNCPDLEVFRLYIMEPYQADPETHESMDEGFGAIVMNCKKLTRLSVSGLVTDQAFIYIGMHGKLIRTLSVTSPGDTYLGLKCVLEGCPNLQKLAIRNCPFGDEVLSSGLHQFYMRFLWMSSCKLTRQACQEVARKLPHLVLEVINSAEDKSDHIEMLYMYGSLDRPQDDAPKVVSIIDEAPKVVTILH